MTQAASVPSDRASAGAAPAETPAVLVLPPLQAVAVIMAVNHLMLIGVLRLTGRQPLRAVVAGVRPLVVPVWIVGGAINLPFGMLFVAAYLWMPWTAVLFLVPLAVLHWATRGAAALRVDRARLAGMQRATHALGVPIDPRDALPDLLAEVRRCFESGVAELVVVFDNRRVVRRARAIVAAKRASTSSVSPWKAENST